MCVCGWPAGKYTYLRRKTQPRLDVSDHDANSGPREITHVAPENVIFVEKTRVVGAPDGGGPVGRLARGSPNRRFAERVLKIFSTPFGPLAPVDA